MTEPSAATVRLAQVAVSDATIYYDKLYTYRVPALLEGHIFVGSMVLVPFGRGRARPRVGVVVELENAADAAVQARVKELYDAAPQEESLPEELLAIVRWLKETCFCTWFEAVRAVLPRGAQYGMEQTPEGWRLCKKLERVTEMVYAAAEVGLASQKLTEKQRQVLGFVQGGPKTRAEICAQLGVSDAVPAGLAKRGLLLRQRRELCADETEGVTPRWVWEELAGAAEARIGDETETESKAADAGEVASPADAGSEAGITCRNSNKVKTVWNLSPSQKEVADRLAACMRQQHPKPALLHGVTGSGKTLVFLQLIRQTLAAGKCALVLVPEIGLTAQMLGALRSAFGSQVAVQHSGLSPTQRVLQWRAILRGQARVVVGTRSAVFAPLANIGLIVVDEEQEHTYQSESAPRYDAVEVARGRAARHGALLVLASATPSVASYYNAQIGRYNLFTLRQRYGNVPLPQVELVDMSAEMMAGNPGALSRRLADAVDETIQNGHQVILLLNKRGYHRVALCRDCGKAVECPDCSVPMVFHKAAYGAERMGQRGAAADVPLSHNNCGYDDGRLHVSLAAGACEAGCATISKECTNRVDAASHATAHKMAMDAGDIAPAGKLVCHYCGRVQQPSPAVCPACGGALRYTGFGTQRLEDELARRLPTARVLRMDMDTTARKGTHARLLRRFSAGEADILLGTQMVAKGLDFERVKLVGVVGIDSLLFGQGYRAFEQVFALVTQVVGRSGRTGQAGQALIQTVNPSHPVLQLAAKQDYEAFYESEAAFRKLALYPPYCTVCVAGFVAAEEEDAKQAAKAFARFLAARAASQPQLPLRVLGPAPMQLARQAGSWRYRLTIKCRGGAAFRALAWQVLADYNKEGWPRTATVFLDFHSDG